MHNMNVFDLKDEGQGHGVQHSQCSYLRADINLYKSHIWEFFVSSHRCKIFTLQNAWSGRRWSRLWCTTLALAPFDGKLLNSYLTAMVMFAFFQPILLKIANWKVWRRQFKSWSLTTTFAVMPFDGEYQPT